MLFIPIFVNAELFGLRNPPGVAPGTVCLKTGCNMSGDIWMNGNTIYNLTLYDVTIVNATQTFEWSMINNIPEGFADNIDNDTKYYNLSEFDNDVGYITDGNTNWDNIYNLVYLDNITWTNLQDMPAGFADNIDNDTKTFGSGYYLINNQTGDMIYISLNETTLNNTILTLLGLTEINASNIEDIWVNETGDSMTGNLNMTGHNITNVFSLGFENNNLTYFRIYDNGTKVTLQLWVNGELQQDWGASTTVYTTATFLDDIFGDGSTLLNVCLPNGFTVQGQPCNATTVFYTDEIWINNINGNATFNESKLNQTISNAITIQGFNGYYVSLDFTNTTGLSDGVDNDTTYENLSEFNNDVGYITDGNTNWDNIYNFITLLNLTWNNILNIPSGFVDGIDNEKTGASPYLYNDSTYIYFNETLLNETIDARSDFDTDTQKDTNGFYLYNDSIYIYFNESMLNQTIDDRSDFNTDYCAGGTCNGNVLILGNLTIIGDYVDAQVTTQYLNGTFLPSIDDIWNIGSPSMRWRYFYVNKIFADDWSNITITESQISDLMHTIDTQKDTNGFYLYNDSTYIYFNETKLNETIYAIAGIVDTNTEKAGAQPYLYNDSDYIYLNETKLNATIVDISEVNVYQENITVTVSGGTGSGQSLNTIDFEITRITVFPPSSANYRFEAVQDSDGDIIDKDRIPHNGIWDIEKSYAIDNDYVNVSIFNANTDGSYIVRLIYLDNYK